MKTTTGTQLEAALEKIKAVFAKMAQAWAKDLAALTAEDVGAASESHTHISATPVTIPKTGWGSDSTATYPKYYDIAVSGVAASDRANVDIAPTALSTAAACGLCPTCETLAGKIRLRAVRVPAASMAATYWIEKGT